MMDSYSPDYDPLEQYIEDEFVDVPPQCIPCPQLRILRNQVFDQLDKKDEVIDFLVGGDYERSQIIDAQKQLMLLNGEDYPSDEEAEEKLMEIINDGMDDLEIAIKSLKLQAHMLMEECDGSIRLHGLNHSTEFITNVCGSDYIESGKSSVQVNLFRFREESKYD